MRQLSLFCWFFYHTFFRFFYQHRSAIKKFCATGSSRVVYHRTHMYEPHPSNTCVGFTPFFIWLFHIYEDYGLVLNAVCPAKCPGLLRVAIYFAVKDSCLDSYWWMPDWLLLRLKWKSFECQMAAHCLRNCQKDWRSERSYAQDKHGNCLPESYRVKLPRTSIEFEHLQCALRLLNVYLNKSGRLG